MTTTRIEKTGLGAAELNRHAVAEGTSEAGMNILTGLAALVGIWGMACLIGGIANSGAMGLIRGFMTAIGM